MNRETASVSKGDKLEVHGFVDVAGMTDGDKFTVKGLETLNDKDMYVLERISTEETLKVRKSILESRLSRKSYIEHLE